MPEEQAAAAPAAPETGQQPVENNAGGAQFANPYEIKIEQPQAQQNTYEVPNGQQEQQESGAEEEKFTIDPELEMDEGIAGMLEETANELKMSKKAAGKYASKIFGKLLDRDVDIYNRQDAALRKEWGGDFQKNIDATSKFIGSVAAQAGWTDQMVNFVKSPLGFKMMHDIMMAAGELNAGQVGSGARGSASGQRGPLTEAERKAIRKDMLQNPQNPYYRGLVDPAAPPDVKRAAEKAFNDTFVDMRPFI